jgi:CRP-like cAMP-binding protein
MEKEFRDLLNEECDYRPLSETMDSFLGLMTEVHLKDGEPLIPYGKLDTNVYVVRSGIIRLAYFDGLTEKTFAFASPGTMIISWYSFYNNMPSFLQFESCGESVVMKVSRSDFNALTEQSHDFARWIIRIFAGQHWSLELRLEEVNGTAKERFVSFLRNRPEIMGNVRLKVIASYIGVTPPYLSRLKSWFRNNSKK